MKDPARESLDEQLSKLARDVSPATDLWPSIARDIGHQFGRGMPRAPRARRPRFAAAAAVAAACGASAVTWAVLHSREVAPTAVSSAANLHTVSFEDPRDKSYLAARADIEKTFQERLALLDPETRTQIESSLAVIRQAHADIRRALSAAPDSPVLEQLLESTLHDEFDLYDQVVRTTQPALSRT
jgi:hypothetical protein